MSTYMKVPGIDGGVRARGYEGWIELGSVDFKANQRIVPQSLVNSSYKTICTTTLSEFLIGKSLDRASPLIFSLGSILVKG